MKDKIISKILKKPELNQTPKEIVEEELNLVLKRNKIDNLDNLSEKDTKFLVKEVRKSLRPLVGMFSSSGKVIDLAKKSDFEGILEHHSSTRERLEFYPDLNSKLNSLPKKIILDLGCGVNPLAISKSFESYFAYDLNKSDLEILDIYFKKNKLNGKTIVYDLRKFKKEDFPKADLALLFKVLDVLEKKGHKLAEKIITGLNVKNVIVSFPTKTLSGKPMNHPQRGWIERMLTRLNLEFEIFHSKNEIFYLISKD